ncbi:hypothetical protein [Streptomyces sp. H27-H5]|uniref:hypothetical protein n=1 Tax=Streptomyces sp. H27-H5 TaxID=2996460 RepID=UPI00226D957E|nr:hypothetical protein [Streptomyces sp. H27-H5]MCY0959949.1 hypothetical protein [Streptomyces sp. H27-H5]
MTDETERRRNALAFNAVQPALKAHGERLPMSVRKAVADAVLAAVDAATGYCPHCGRGDAGPTADEYETLRRRAIGHVEIIGDVRDWARKHLTPEQQDHLRDVLSRGRKADEATDRTEEALVTAERCHLENHHARVEDGRADREALARVRAAISDLAGERLLSSDMRKAVVTAIERPAEQSILRPTHDDGTPYQYNEIVVEGWSHCDGCRTWIRGYTGSNPHLCDADRQTVGKEARP